MFDELKDPRPPQVTDVHIVSVIARAHRIRRRQRIAMFTTSAAFAGAIGGLALVSRGPSSTDREFASSASTGAPSFAPAALATTIALPTPTRLPQNVADEGPSLTEPAVEMTEPGPAAEAVAVTEAASDGSSFQARSTDVVNEVVPPSPPVASTVQAISQPKTAIASQFVAVAGDTGDLVRVDTATGASTVLVSAVRPNPGAAGGTITATLTAGGISPDGLSAYYTDSTTGTVYAVTIANPELAPPSWGQGTDPKLSPNGSRWIVRNSDSTISVHSKTESDQTAGSPPHSAVVDYTWYGDDEIALLEHDGAVWTVRIFDATLAKETQNPSTLDDPFLAGGPDAVSVRFVGRTVNGVLMTAQRREPGPTGPITQYLWVRPGPGSEDKWSSLPGSYTAITVDRSGEWLLRLAADGTLVTDAVGGALERKVAGNFRSVAW